MYKEAIFHRNSQKRYYGEGKTYYIVTKTHENFPYFRELIFCELFIEELKLCKEMKNFVLFAWSIIYDHVNLLIKTREEYNISQIMKSLKENVSRDANYIITGKTNEGDTSTCRLHLKEMIGSWQIEYDKKYNRAQCNFPLFKWQKSFHDHVIRGQKDFYHHYGYTVNNPLKHGLPENWPWSSENHIETVDYFEM